MNPSCYQKANEKFSRNPHNLINFDMNSDRFALNESIVLTAVSKTQPIYSSHSDELRVDNNNFC